MVKQQLIKVRELAIRNILLWPTTFSGGRAHNEGVNWSMRETYSLLRQLGDARITIRLNHYFYFYVLPSIE